jgi:hypothetical protein
MKLSELSEMTLTNLTTQTDNKTKPYFDYLYQNGQHIGDQDGLEIISAPLDNGVIYGIKRNDIITTFVTFEYQSDSIWILKMVHSLEQYRGSKDAHKIIWFIKSQEGKAMLDYGVQTLDGIRFVKSLSLTKRFAISWLNTKTNEKIPYDPKTDSPNNTPYRSHINITDWKILIESDERPSFTRYDREFVKGIWCIFEHETDSY